jgi:hypothetical protein
MEERESFNIYLGLGKKSPIYRVVTPIWISSGSDDPAPMLFLPSFGQLLGHPGGGEGVDRAS